MTMRTFTYEEALDLFPMVHAVTASAVEKLGELLDGREIDSEDDVPDDLIAKYNEIVSEWADSINELGIEVKGLWLVDFDSGSGYYCWKWPEPSIQHFHGYDEGFDARVKLN